ncbi:MAG TPA: diguanylate cyclase [Thermoleophilaceae bacterium]|nr:diguanylate cyclase [Thermoleophilaceae bacterium]
MIATSPQMRTFLRAAGALLCVTWLAYAVHALLAAGQHANANTFAYDGMLLAAACVCLLRAVLIERERRVWAAVGVGLLSWTAGEIYYSVVVASGDEVPIPSPADVGYLGLYPACYLAIAWLLRERLGSFPRSLWLDGAIVASAASAVAIALTFDPIVEASVDGDALAVATNLAYPIADLALLSLVLTAFAFTGWRPGRSWVLLGSGLATLAVSDVGYLFQSAGDTYVEGGIVDAGWPLCALLVCAAAWTEPAPHRAVRMTGLRMAAVPTVAALVAVALLGYDHFERISTPAALLSTFTLAAVVGRMTLTFRANQRLLEGARDEALTDALTGLGNRRRLMQDLDRVTSEHPGASGVGLLVMLDLDGFKAYNDAFGHPAGDSLLARLGHRMAAAAMPLGTAYRLGGDEFCVLARCRFDQADHVVAAARAALSSHGEGFNVTASSGTVVIPADAATPTDALQLADHRMYANKGRGRVSAGSQSRDVLVSALRERQPDLHMHAADVAQLAVDVAAELGMDAEHRDEVARAAELHDTGKVAIPDAILDKPGPLDDDEWEFMRRHTIIGERILSSAPALIPVAKLVRSSHERWDGEGYPDGLTGEEIPLGARVVTVCDAYDAMIADRPYRAPKTSEEAMEELRRCAGSQFDPAVVAAFETVLDRMPVKG